MTQVYDEGGRLVPVTVIEAGPCTVLQLKTADRDGYEAVQLGFDDKLSQKDQARSEDQRHRSRASRAERGRVVSLGSKRERARKEAGVELLPRAGGEAKRFIREFRTDGEDHGCEVGQELTLDVLAEVSHVDVIGLSKGRGFAGVMKRHNFSGQRASHGVKRVHRHGGSIGMSADPARVLKGTRMGGRYGHSRTTVRHLQVVKVDAANNMLLVRGAVPGPNGGYLTIQKTNKLG
jgi:large subunit ribosomal protein L3